MPLTARRVRDKASDFGFDLCGIVPAAPSPTLAAYESWVAQGMHGEMGYMARPDRVARRRDLSEILPNARSLIVVGVEYMSSHAVKEAAHDPSRGRIASYAWGLDYHDVLGEQLERFAEWALKTSRRKLAQKVYVDTGAILERSHAQQAGLGFIGKNTMLINPVRGSSFFLAEIITSLDFDDYDEPHAETMCGTCARCLAACPTDAFVAPFALDARRCISYHTIENKGWIDRDLRASFGNWIFGCDICVNVCPFQRFAGPVTDFAFLPEDFDRVAPLLADVLAYDERKFRLAFKGTPVQRVGRDRLVRNACIAAGNWRDESLAPALTDLLLDESALVRGHAAWALWRIMGEDSEESLKTLYELDDDARVRGEIEGLLEAA